MTAKVVCFHCHIATITPYFIFGIICYILALPHLAIQSYGIQCLQSLHRMISGCVDSDSLSLFIVCSYDWHCSFQYVSGCADGNISIRCTASFPKTIPLFVPFAVNSLSASIAACLLMQSVPTSAKFVPSAGGNFPTYSPTSSRISMIDLPIYQSSAPDCARRLPLLSQWLLSLPFCLSVHPYHSLPHNHPPPQTGGRKVYPQNHLRVYLNQLRKGSLLSVSRPAF